MSTLIDDALARARDDVPEVIRRDFGKSCRQLGTARDSLQGFADDVARRAAHAQAYGLPSEEDEELLDQLTPLQKRACELHGDMATLYNSIASVVEVQQHVPVWDED